MAGAIDGGTHPRNVAPHAGGRLVVRDEDRLDYVVLITTEMLLHSGGVNGLPPIRRQHVDTQPQGAGHPSPGLGEVTAIEAQDPVSGRQRVHQSRLPRSAP